MNSLDMLYSFRLLEHVPLPFDLVLIVTRFVLVRDPNHRSPKGLECRFVDRFRDDVQSGTSTEREVIDEVLSDDIDEFERKNQSFGGHLESGCMIGKDFREYLAEDRSASDGIHNGNHGPCEE
jgi:hypothetical protein